MKFGVIMKIYLAPLEGITNYIYRNAYHTFFTPADKYFTPFISTNQHLSYSTKERKEIQPEHNKGLYVVPQILSNKADEFVNTVNDIKQYGYTEFNLNLGCPSNTVVAKNKGSGFLFHQEQLEAFLDTVFSQIDVKLSIKTRLGKFNPEEFYALMAIFKKYPLEELIVHPRITKDFYKNTPRLELFDATTHELPFPVSYNGDVFNINDYRSIIKRFPQIDSVMLGRGVISNPGLIGEIKNEKPMTVETFKAFHDRLLQDYIEVMSGDKNVLHKMKEFWFYCLPILDVSEKYAKKIKKCEKLTDYRSLVDAVFSEGAICEDRLGYRKLVPELPL